MTLDRCPGIREAFASCCPEAMSCPWRSRLAVCFTS